MEGLSGVRAMVESADPVSMGNNLELFVDDALLSSMSGAALELQTPQLADMSLSFMDKPWEGSWSGQTPTILKDGNLYRMYYFAASTRLGPEDGPSRVCCAESRDGVAWTRPNLGQVEFGGSLDNNILLMPDPNIHLIYPFIDGRPGIPPTQRYKAVTQPYHSKGADGATWLDGLYILVSPDGLQWTQYSPTPFLPAQRWKNANGTENWPDPVERDGNCTMFWSQSEQLYVSLARAHIKASAIPKPNDSYAGAGWYRWVKRMTSPDLQTWSTQVWMDTGGLPPEHWYNHSTTPYFRVPQIYIGMPSHYIPIAHPDFPNDPGDGHSARCETRFVSSRAGTSHYDRLFPSQRFITTGLPNADFFFPGQSNWPVFAGRVGLNAVPTGPREMSIYLEQPGRVVRYTLRTDGFVALKADAGGVGVAITKPLTFAGSTMEINMKAGTDGNVKVELQDGSGRALPGFTVADATAMTGDEISKIVTWGATSNVGRLAGQIVRVRFQLQNAKIFSFHFLT